MGVTTIISAIETGLIFSIMSLGIFITFKILDFPDLTVDGSFTLGGVVGCVFAVGGHPILGILFATIAGSVAGLATAFFHTKLKVNYILAGIITMTGLYSINLMIGKSNISLFGSNTIFTLFKDFLENINISSGFIYDNYKIILILLFVICILIILNIFFKTQTGMAIRATGDNESMVRASSISTDPMKICGLMIANALVAMCSSVYTQYLNFYDLSTGIGMMVAGLCGIIIGEALFGKRSILNSTISIVLGAIIYRIIIAIAINGIGLDTTMWKLVSAVVVIIIISFPVIVSIFAKHKTRRINNADIDMKKEVSEALHIENLSITFNANTINEKKALDNVSLDLNSGDFVTVIGSNGAGKSTLLNCISGTYIPDTGYVVLNNKNITFKKEHKRAKTIGRLFQDPLKGTAPNMSIEDNLSLAYRRGSRHNGIYARFLKTGLNSDEKQMMKDKISHLGLGLEERLHSKVGLLSGGQRQALTLMMATINTPELLLLDEHTAALDPKTANKVMKITNDIVSEGKITTLMITHNIKQALEYGNRMIVMSEGKILMEFSAEEKAKLSVEDVMKIYSKNSQDELSDKMILD